MVYLHTLVAIDTSIVDRLIAKNISAAVYIHVVDSSVYACYIKEAIYLALLLLL